MAHIYFIYLFVLHWDEMPGQKEKVHVGDIDVWQLHTKSFSHLLSDQSGGCCSNTRLPRKLLAPCGAGARCAARLTLAPGGMLALLLQVASVEQGCASRNSWLAATCCFIADSFGRSCCDNSKNQAPKNYFPLHPFAGSAAGRGFASTRCKGVQ